MESVDRVSADLVAYNNHMEIAHTYTEGKVAGEAEDVESLNKENMVDMIAAEGVDCQAAENLLEAVDTCRSSVIDYTYLPSVSCHTVLRGEHYSTQVNGSLVCVALQKRER